MKKLTVVLATVLALSMGITAFASSNDMVDSEESLPVTEIVAMAEADSEKGTAPTESIPATETVPATESVAMTEIDATEEEATTEEGVPATETIPATEMVTEAEADVEEDATNEESVTATAMATAIKATQEEIDVRAKEEQK